MGADSVVISYLPVFIFFVFVLIVAIAMLTIGKLFRPNNPDPVKLAPYECGNVPIGDARGRFHIRYYIIGMLFVLFDMETVFLIPWAITFHKTKLVGFVAMMTFIGILLIGYLYVWRKGALDWD